MLAVEIVTIGAIFLASIIIAILCARTPNILIYEDGFHIKGFYGTKIFSDEIGSITLVDEMPKITMRTNGYAGTKKLKGFFKVKGVKKARLSVMNKKAAPFIKVVTTKGTLLINRSTSEETLALYDEMKKTIKFEENTEINCQAVDKRRLLSAIVIVAVVAISLGISLLPLLLNNGAGSFSIKDNGLVLDGAHGYGRTIPINDVLSVQLIDSLPHISRRTNGYAVGNVNFGHYKLKDGRKCMLYLNDASQKPFIQIETVDNLYFINCTTSDETAALYRKLMENN